MIKHSPLLIYFILVHFETSNPIPSRFHFFHHSSVVSLVAQRILYRGYATIEGQDMLVTKYKQENLNIKYISKKN